MEITEIKELASDCLASLHLTNGKAQIPTSWSSEIKTALGGIGMALNGIVGDGWSEGEFRPTGNADWVDTYRIVPPSAPSGFVLPMDAVERLPLALAHLDGWAESVLALLRYAHLMLSVANKAEQQVSHLEACSCAHCSDRGCWTEMPELDT